MNKLVYIVLTTFLLASCASHRNYNFGLIDKPEQLNGYYADTSGTAPFFFNWGLPNAEGYAYDSIDIYRLTFNNHMLELRGQTQFGELLINSYEGKFDIKNNCFEIDFKKDAQRFLVFNSSENDKLKIGLDSAKNLVLNRQYDKFQNILIFATGKDTSFTQTMTPISHIDLVPARVNVGWGYNDTTGTTRIPMIFGFARLFRGNTARVQNKGLWSLINKQGSIVTKKVYNKIEALPDSTYIAHFDGKLGLLNNNGNEITEPKYKSISAPEIKDGLKPLNTYITKLDNKYGIVIGTTESFPPIFDKVVTRNLKKEGNNLHVANLETSIDNKKYAVDAKGNLYPLKFPVVQVTSFMSSVNIGPAIHYTELLGLAPATVETTVDPMLVAKEAEKIIPPSNSFTLTSQGLASLEDNTKHFVVIPFEDKSAKELYTSTKRYINEIARTVDTNMKSEAKDDYIKYNTILSKVTSVKESDTIIDYDAQQDIEIRFREGRIRYDITAFTIYQKGQPSKLLKLQSKDGNETAIYDRKSHILLESQKIEIENKVNNTLNQLTEYIENDDW